VEEEVNITVGQLLILIVLGNMLWDGCKLVLGILFTIMEYIIKSNSQRGN
jgi:hypothetical protein